MITLVAGGAGFIGSHLCEQLLGIGHRVICIDNLITGRLSNIQSFMDYPMFTFIEHDIVLAIPIIVAHLACASAALPV